MKQILKLVIHTDLRPPSMQQLEGVCVAKLETAAMEALSNFFQDPTKPRNAGKQPILKEIFKVARAEEKFTRNEIGGLPPRTVLTAVRTPSWAGPAN